MASSNNDGNFPLTIVGGIALGVTWTIIAGTLWQWVPIAGALTAVHVVKKVMEEQLKGTKTEKPKSPKKPRKKGGDGECPSPS